MVLVIDPLIDLAQVILHRVGLHVGPSIWKACGVMDYLGWTIHSHIWFCCPPTLHELPNRGSHIDPQRLLCQSAGSDVIPWPANLISKVLHNKRNMVFWKIGSGHTTIGPHFPFCSNTCHWPFAWHRRRLQAFFRSVEWYWWKSFEARTNRSPAL